MSIIATIYRPLPHSVPWLKSRHEEGHYISRKDVARVLRSDPAAATDPFVLDYIIRGLEGRLPKPPGRPKRTFAHEARIVVAGMLAQEQMTAWRSARAAKDPSAPKRGRSEPSLSEAAYEQAARQMALGSGRALQNDLCSLKGWPYFHD